MKFTIRRTYLPLGTLGSMTDDAGNFICYTIERPRDGEHPCVSEGTYTAGRYDSPKHGPNTWQLDDVPGRSNIQFHVANWPHELLGCIAPGFSKQLGPNNEPGVAGSRSAYNRFMVLTANESQIVFEILGC